VTRPAVLSFALLVVVGCGGQASLRASDDSGAGLGGEGGSAGASVASASGLGGLPQWYCSETLDRCYCELVNHPGSLHPCVRHYACCVAQEPVCVCDQSDPCDAGDGEQVARCPAFLGGAS
jgi:hypothetical protein